MGEVDPKKTGFEYKHLESSKSKINMPLEDAPGDVEFKEDPNYNKFQYKRLDSNSAATMYGSPSPLEMKSHPLYKKGKMSPCYNIGGPEDVELEEWEKPKPVAGSGTANENLGKTKKIKRDRHIPTKF